MQHLVVVAVTEIRSARMAFAFRLNPVSLSAWCHGKGTMRGTVSIGRSQAFADSDRGDERAASMYTLIVDSQTRTTSPRGIASLITSPWNWSKKPHPPSENNSRARIGLHGNAEHIRVPHGSARPTGTASTKITEEADIMPDVQTMRTSMASGFRSDDERWAAVVDRNHAAVGEFVYCVTTTGVYCRPGCAARHPRRENVRFHTSCKGAENAGFRSCRRCRPNEPPLAERHARSVAAACRLVETAEELPYLDALAQVAGMSRFHFHRVFKAITGFTPRAYTAAHRADRTRETLRTSRTVTEAIYDSGINSSARFYAASPEMLGMAPAVFQGGGAGETIRFAVGECSLGSILVAATTKGICAILFGDDPAALARELEDRFPQAELVGGDGEFESLVARIVGLIEAPSLGIDLPIDIRGTTFQRRIWLALCDVPAGTIASYSEIADRVGSPKAARAVARACAANPLAVAIPCHRVVRNDGTLGGYRWGVERKRMLLAREASS